MTELIPATLIRRYKRFLADVRLEDGSELTVHCPNTGSMKNCMEIGGRVLLRTSDNPARKYKFTWEITHTGRGHYIGVNTMTANRLVREAIENGVISELQGYPDLRAEARYGVENSRIDFLLAGSGKPDCYVEVKSVTLLESPIRSGIGYFPDAVSKRGAKHLRELEAMVASGHRAVLLFCVQHSGIFRVRPADHVDPGYGEHLRHAIASGVEVLAYKARFAGTGMRLGKSVPFELNDHDEGAPTL
jgi:sugar fermentation stimulation protein A